MGRIIPATNLPEVFERSLALNKAERTHYQEEIERLKDELAVIEQQHAGVEALEQVRERIFRQASQYQPRGASAGVEG